MASGRGDGAILVTVIGGYLGAGKTSLVNHLLRTTGERFAVLVNDFGAINIDESLITSADDQTINLANGCICCSLVDGFANALQRVQDLPDPPPRLVIEASGVADPALVAAYGHGPGLALDGVIVVVDAETIQARAVDEYVGDTVRLQLAAADLVVLNKLDLVDVRTEAAARSVVAGLAAGAPVLDAVEARVPAEVVLGQTPLDRPPSTAGPHPPAVLADDVFESWSFATDAAIDRTDLDLALADLPADVLRLKGIVRLADRPEERVVVQRVGSRSSVTVDGEWPGGPSRVVAIGLRGAIDDRWLAQRLAAL